MINDLYNTRGQGDLTVDVVEANGQVSRFTVPYSAVPDSIRPGNWNYELAMGYVRQYYSVENKFVEGVLQRGMSNVLTANMGSRLADNYQAFLAGGVLATSVGAFGLNTVFSSAHVENNEKQQGWRVEASYSKTFTTGTNLVLAAYRYSTSGYRDLQDVLGVRRQEKNGTLYYSDTLNQRNNFSATLSQPMGDWGMLSFTGSTSDYYNNASRITQLQLGYSNSWRDISFNISAARQRSTYSSRYFSSVNDRDFDNESQRKYTENTVSLGISIPFDFGSSRSQINLDMNRSRDSRTATVGMSGTTGERVLPRGRSTAASSTTTTVATARPGAEILNIAHPLAPSALMPPGAKVISSMDWGCPVRWSPTAVGLPQVRIPATPSHWWKPRGTRSRDS